MRRARIFVREGRFEIVDRGSEYILEPQSGLHRRLPEKEDLTMHLAAAAEIEVPAHGLVRCRDGSWTCFIRRFDRLSRDRKLTVEDFGRERLALPPAPLLTERCERMGIAGRAEG